MTADENFIVAIITQAIEDTTYTGTVKDKIKFNKLIIESIIESRFECVSLLRTISSPFILYFEYK